MIEFRALGSLAVLDDGDEVSIGGPRQRRLLAMLLIHHDEVVSVDRLADAVFEGEPTDAAHTTMRSYVARIRRIIRSGEPTVELVTKAPGYCLRTTADLLDARRFEELLDEGRRHLSIGDAAVAALTIRAALDIWRGGAYAEFADEEWARPAAQRLEELRLVAQERLIEAELASGRPAETIARVEALAAEHPLREGFRAQQMLALYRSGRQVDALRVYRDYRQTLIDEIGVEPSPALADLERRILEHDSSLDLIESAGEPLRGYRLGRRVGTGPNGTMHVARLDGVHHEMTLSVLSDQRVDRSEFVRSFEANAHQIASVNHPAIVPLHDYWREPGAAYVVTRRPSGVSLRERLERDPMRPVEVEALVGRVGGALVEAASRGVEHGWITLDNVFVDDEGDACITNFVVCPSTSGHDVADLAAVVRACVGRCDPPLGAGARCAVDEALVNVETSMDDFVVGVAHALRVASGDGETTDSAVTRPNPFKGLRAFDEADAGDFHGRDDLAAELIARVTSRSGPRLTLVVGGSGSGKSSVVRAGVLPRVRSGEATCGEQWFVTTMLPGSAPFKELAESLRRIAVADVADLAVRLRSGAITLEDAVGAIVPDGGRLLLVVDQFEELFTLTPDDEQQAFLDVLAGAVESPEGRVHVLATLRADFYDRPLAAPRFGALVGPATIAVPPLSASELEEVIVRPVAALGATAEPALVAELIAAAVDQPGALPALQFTLFELADRRADRCLTIADYRELGGLDHAIAARAEGLYQSLDDAGRLVVRDVFEQLVVIGVDAEPSGRRSARADLASGERATDVHEMIDHWTAARLLTGDNDPRSRVPTVQVAHEALLRSWPRLRHWIADDRDAIIELHRLRDATAEWVRVDRDGGALYRGARLEAAFELTRSRRDALPVAEREFLAASLELREQEEREAAEHIERQARANRRLRIQLAAIGAALVVALVVGFIAIDQRGAAQDERDAADVAGREATARELAAAADATVTADPERAILLALEAIDTTRSVDGTALPPAVDALHRAVTESRVLVTVPGVGGRLDWSPVDDTFVTEGPEETGMIDIRNATTGESVLSFRGDEIDVNEVEYSRDGSKLAVAGDDGVLKIFDPATGELLSSVIGDGPVWDPTFTADGSTILAQWIGEQMIRRVDVASGEVLGEVSGQVQDLALSPDGTKVAVSLGAEPFAIVVSSSDVETLATLENADASIAVRWNPDGSMIALASQDGILRVFDPTTGAVIASTSAHDAELTAVAWSRDGTQLATGGYDGTARVWEIRNGALVQTQRFQSQDLEGGVPGVAFSPDGTRLAVSDWAITSTKIFDLSPTGAAELLNVEANALMGASVLPSGDVMSVGSDGVLQFTDVGTGESRRWDDDVPLDGPSPVVSPDGATVALFPEGGDAVQLREASSGRLLAEYAAPNAPYLDELSWGPGSDVVAVASSTSDLADGDVTVVDVNGDPLASLSLPGVFVQSMSFSADGSTVAIAGTARVQGPGLEVISLWDWRGDEIVAELPVKAVHLAYDPTGRYLAATRFNDGRAEILDATTGEPIVTLDGSTAPLDAVAFAPDGERVVTGGHDGMVRVWETATGSELGALPAREQVRSVAFAPSGEWLVSLDDDGVARIWTLDTDELIAIAERRVTRTLTDAECRRYLQLDGCPA